jgi:hypothetical protein
MNVRWRSVFAVLLSVGLGACASVQMDKAEKEPVRGEGEAMVVFMRSTFVGSAISASVFDVSGPSSKFVGLVQNGTKVAYPVKPGKYTFMVVSEAADFMEATVAAGRTYYAMVTPRMGMWKARFSFRPVRQNELTGSEFAGWNGATHFVVASPQAEGWASANFVDIASKRLEYWPQWSSKPAEERAAQTLNEDDGRR